MTKEEKRRIKEGKRLARLRAKEVKRAQKLREKEERKAAKSAKTKGGQYVRGNEEAAVSENTTRTSVDNTETASETQRSVVQESSVQSQSGDNRTDETEIDESIADDVKKPVNRPKNYHVSLREDGKWQVKFAKGSRALKLFDTQAEAIAFAKEKAENQDGTITIHKKDGKIRKQRYDK